MQVVDNQPIPIPKPPRLFKEDLIRIDDTTTTTTPPRLRHPANPDSLLPDFEWVLPIKLEPCHFFINIGHTI